VIDFKNSKNVVNLKNLARNDKRIKRIRTSKSKTIRVFSGAGHTRIPSMRLAATLFVAILNRNIAKIICRKITPDNIQFYPTSHLWPCGLNY